MSAFSPKVPPLPRLPHRELLGRYVPTALRRTPVVARFVHPIRLAMLGLITAGLLPCRMLQRRVQRVLLMHAHQTELAGDLLAISAPTEAKPILQESIARVRVSPLLSQASVLALLAAVAAGIVYLHQHDYSLTAIGHLWLHPLRFANPLTQAFVGLIAVAYLLLILQMNRQLAAMQQLAIAVNGIFDGQPPLALPRLVFVGRSPLTLLLGLALAWLGLAWALPMAVAWSAFGQFVGGSAHGFRAEFSDRLQNVSGVTPVVETRDLCASPHCRNLIPEGAEFCPRCGTRVAGGEGV